MNCELSANMLHGYFDGELDAVRASEFEEHMAGCALCRTSLTRMRTLREALQKGDLYQGASSRLRSEIREELGSQTRTSRARWRWLLIPAVSLALLLIAIRVGSVLTEDRTYSARFQAELLDAHVRSLQPGHLTDVNSSDQHTVKPWFDGRLDFIPPVADFSERGFPLLGGRLDVLEGRNVAALVYGRRKHLVNLFVWPESKPVPISGEGSRQGFNWLSWRERETQFCLVSDVSPGDLHELQQLLER